MLRSSLRIGIIVFVAAIVVAAILWRLAGGTFALPADASEIPSLTIWGKIFAFLLLGALGVAYLVWRRPLLQAQAILETSPLGGGQAPSPLVDWGLYLKTLVVIEMCLVVAVVVLHYTGRPISTLDTFGTLASGAIVALVVHLLILARGGSGRDR